MAMFKCKMCGGGLDVNEDIKVVECEYCGTKQTVPSMDNEKKINLFNRANRLRFANEFDKAAGVYESIAAEFPEEAEAYWGLCLCKYGIEYVDDPATGKKIPTCHRTSFDSIFNYDNFELVMEYADSVAVGVYREEAKEIDRLQKAILDIAKNEEPFDIFICYKETAEDGQRTKDSVLAQDMYDKLTEKGYKVFFARITLEDKLGKEYEPYIFSALNSVKVMLAVGTKYEYYNAVWVKNEWSRFLDMMKNDKEKVLIPCYADIDAYDMPAEFKNLQGQDMGKVGSMQDLVRGIGKIIPIEKKKSMVPVKKYTQQVVTDSPNIQSLLERVFICLDDGNKSKANSLLEKILNTNPKCSKAYYAKFMIDENQTNLEKSYKTPYSYDLMHNKNFARAYQYADANDRKIYEKMLGSKVDRGYLNINHSNWEEAEKLFNEAISEDKNCSKAYFGKFLVDFGITSKVAKEVDFNCNLEQHGDFMNAYNNSSGNEHQEYDEILKRNISYRWKLKKDDEERKKEEERIEKVNEIKNKHLCEYKNLNNKVTKFNVVCQKILFVILYIACVMGLATFDKINNKTTLVEKIFLDIDITDKLINFIVIIIIYIIVPIIVIGMLSPVLMIIFMIITTPVNALFNQNGKKLNKKAKVHICAYCGNVSPKKVKECEQCGCCSLFTLSEKEKEIDEKIKNACV